MKYFNKKFLIVIFTIFSFINVFAIDYGANLKNDTKISPNEDDFFNLLQRNDLSAWIKVPFNENNSAYLVSEGLYRFEYNNSGSYRVNYIDLSMLQFVLNKEIGDNLFSLNLGRFAFTDLTSCIFGQPADGVSFSFDSSVYNFSLYAAYTGLLNSNVIKMINSEDFEIEPEKVYALSDKFATVALGFSLPELIPNNTLSLQGLGAIRLDEIANNKFYLTVGLDGVVNQNIFYSVYGTASLKSYDKEDYLISPFAKADLNFIYDKLFLNVNALFAGQDFEGVTSFVALNSGYEPEYNSLLKAGVLASYRILDNVKFFASADIAFNGKENYSLKGFQYDIGCDWQVVSDVYIGLDWNQYIDIDESDANYKAVNLKAMISF